MSSPVFVAPASINRCSDGQPSESAMRTSAEKRRGCAGFCPQGCVDFLTARHPVKTAAGVEAATRGAVPARTVERWLVHDAAPSLKAFARLVVAYGPAFAAAAVPGLGWLEDAAALADHAAVSREIAALEARQAGIAARMTLRPNVSRDLSR